jgi:endonuclease/exonuclease/phosphatase (EEP) superfamily protein YafD
MAENQGSRGRIVVVDDDPQIRTMLGVRLRGAGYTVVEADDGAAALAACASFFWPGELVASLAWHVGWLAFATALALASLGRAGRALAAATIGALLAGPELSLWLPRDDAALRAGEAELRVAALNLLFFNEDAAGVRAWLDEHEPDVVVAVEVSPFWRAAIEGWDDRFPELLISPAAEAWKDDTWGTAILSRLPFTSTRMISPERGRPLMEAVVRVDASDVTVRGVHPLYPGSPWMRTKRDRVFEELAQEAWTGPCVLAGDLNTASTSPTLRRFLRATGLADSRRGFGRQPTFVLRDLLPLAIDHVLIGGGVRVLARETSELPGSDHRAVLVLLAIPADAR